MSLWSCTTCSKLFARKGDLTRHQAVHTGIRPHICETCGKGFAQRSGLKTHRNVHSKARPFTCGIGTCKKAFGDPSSRTRHRNETHRREGAYKCIVADCGTRIKRRSAFMAHLRKHGLNPESLDMNGIILQSCVRSATAHPAPPEVHNKSDHKTESRSPPSCVDGSLGNHVSGDGSDASQDNNRCLGDDPFDYRRGYQAFVNDALLLDPMLHRTVNVVGPSDSQHDIYTYMSSMENPLCFDGIWPVDCPLLATSPPSFPVLEPFLEAGSGGSQSSWSSPSSTYSALCPSDLDDDVVSMSLTNMVSQEYNLII